MRSKVNHVTAHARASFKPSSGDSIDRRTTITGYLGMQSTPTRSRGITLIELVVVLVILGALGATLVPQMLDTRHEALVARQTAFATSFYSSLTQQRACWMARGSGTTVQNLAACGDGTLDFNAHGWVSGGSGSNSATMESTNECIQTFQAMVPGARVQNFHSISFPDATWAVAVTIEGGVCTYRVLTTAGAVYPMPGAAGDLRFQYGINSGSPAGRFFRWMDNDGNWVQTTLPTS